MNAGAKRFRIVVLAIIVVAGLSTLFRLVGDRETPEQKANSTYQMAKLSLSRGDSEEAEQLARRAVQLDGRFDKARLLAAEIAASRKAYPLALEDLSSITDETGDEWIAAQQLAAEILHYGLHRFRKAEQAYRNVLALRPDDLTANDGYARLLGLCGRRQEAIPHVLRLIRSGEDTDLLMLLSRESGALSDPDMLRAAREADPTDPNPLLGLAHAADSAQNPARALQLFQEAAPLDGLPEDFHGRFGWQLLANDRFDDLDRWMENIDFLPRSFDTWIVLGELAERAEDSNGAIRCYWEAAKMRPESRLTINRLAQKLISEQQPTQAEPFLRRVQGINELRDRQQVALMSNELPEGRDVVEMVRAYRSVGRVWEALAWGRVALAAHPDIGELREIVGELEARISRLPLELTDPDENPALQVDLTHFPVPDSFLPSSPVDSNSVSGNISFQPQSAEIGFDFQYFNGTSEASYRMFEFAGGGIAILDFDNDGAPDIFCTQGRKWDLPRSEASPHFDRLFHNRQGRSFVEISQQAGFSSETGFGQGVSAGDVNNDGFVDLYVANTGTNTLWLNNGDGTFTDHSVDWDDQSGRWTTSCLIADVNGDSFPDLYDVNYLAGDDVFDRLCEHNRGGKDMCAPKDFAPAADQLWLGDGMGGFRDATAEFLSPPPDGKGLGIAAFNAGDNRLSLFVANDTTANFFYTFDSPDATSMTDIGLIAGLALNEEGRAEACMGIAVGDCTQDGRLDLLVTNFLYESNTLYSPVGERLYTDRTRDLNLHAASVPVLGFGTQFLDANLDGRLELFVVNGFTHDLSKFGTPYK
ncbi:MAG TPA: FG-GAP-like repeat-containing protein, partial [Planctomycetaceae bacterium]|nr:FG-GAP-like repeat-containing protein [Planctomycetaceae bacterium]